MRRTTSVTLELDGFFGGILNLTQGKRRTCAILDQTQTAEWGIVGLTNDLSAVINYSLSCLVNVPHAQVGLPETRQALRVPKSGEGSAFFLCDRLMLITTDFPVEELAIKVQR